MTASSIETWALCGGVTHANAPADALRLSVGDDTDSMTVDIAGVSQALTGRLSARFTDLIRIAAFVLGADDAISRGKLDDADGGKRWHRAFRLVVAVEDPSFWNQTEVTTALEETPSFLSQDNDAAARGLGPGGERRTSANPRRIRARDVAGGARGAARERSPMIRMVWMSLLTRNNEGV